MGAVAEGAWPAFTTAGDIRIQPLSACPACPRSGQAAPVRPTLLLAVVPFVLALGLACASVLVVPGRVRPAEAARS